MRVRVKNKLVGVAAVSMRTTLKYRRNWNKNGPAVKLLRKFMPTDGAKKGYRLFIDVGDSHKLKYTVPPAVRVALKRAGYVVSDYLAKKCVKITDKEQKNVFNIGKVIAKDEHAKNAFDNDPQLQNSKSNKIQVVISCHPYDIIGMSTGRDWDEQSCMRLKDNRVGVSDGAYHKHVEKDVAEGTLVAYAIRADDTNIQNPLCRCLVKPFVSEDEDVLYRREGRIYGNTVPGFDITLNGFIRKLNAHVPEGFYKLVSGLYDDGNGRSVTYSGVDGQEADVELEMDDLRTQPHLLVQFVKQYMDSDRPVATKSSVIVKALLAHARKASDEELDEIADLIKPNTEMPFAFNYEALRNGLDRPMSYIAHRAGLLNIEGKNFDNMELDDHANLSIHGGDALHKLIIRLEDDFSTKAITRLAEKFMTGASHLPTLEMFDKSPKVLSYIYTIASAARFYTLWNDDIYERQVHDLLEVLGTDIPKVTDQYFFRGLVSMGPIRYVMGLCVLLDNADTADSEMMSNMQVGEIIGLLANRRPFKAFERPRNSAFTHYMERVKYAMFQRCMAKPYDQDKFKPNKSAIIAYMDANPDEFDSVEWDHFKFNALLKYNAPMVVRVGNNAGNPTTHEYVTSLLDALSTYEGEPLDPGENGYMEFLLRLAVFAGNNMDPAVRVNTKVALDNLDNDAFPAWFAENKKGNSVYSLVDIMRWVGYGTVGGTIEHRGVVLSRLLPLIIENSNTDNGVNAWGSFSMSDIAQNHRAIIKSIQRLPDMSNAINALEQFVDSIELEETEDETEGANTLIEGGEFGIQLDEDDDEYHELHAEQVEEARLIIEAKNSKKLALNERLHTMIGDLNRNLGGEDTDEEEIQDCLDYFFDKFSEEAREAHQSEMEDIAEVVSNKLSDLDHYYEEYRRTAGY